MKVPLDAEGNYAGGVEIYQLTAPNGKIYVGQAQCYRRAGNKWAAKGFKGRWREHKYEAAKGKNQEDCRLLYHSLRKYGADSFKTEILLRVSKSLANFYEAKFIRVLGTLSPSGLNLQEGGGTTVFSEETRRRLSESAKKRVYTEEDCAKMAARKRASRVSRLPHHVVHWAAHPDRYVGEGYCAQIRHKGRKYTKAELCSLLVTAQAQGQQLKNLVVLLLPESLDSGFGVAMQISHICNLG